ncbi:MAG: glycosyltransferase [Alphaproteobacteria bacterium]|nr:glycosyltransferase [Alphaproteobacteria bacterium]
MSPAEFALVAVYVGIAVALSLYGLHRYHLTWLFLKHRSDGATPHTPAAWPVVTVQLPLYNEPRVVTRAIDAVAALDYPADRLEVQILDDSTDGTTAMARAAVERWRKRGVDIRLIHRDNREGYKAGALAEGMERARGRFIAVFDADFLPQADFLTTLLPYFRDDVGMVQARWGHLNEHSSLLTRLQAVLLDGHFVIEHTARNRSGRWFNFNGTAGIWRREAIEDAGGWHHDTLTEDLDLSYRAQLAGWRFVFLPDVVVPAELPGDIAAFKTQQHRWAKGSVQTARKLLPTLLRAPLPLRVRVEAVAHLTANLAYPMVVLLTAITPLAVRIRGESVGRYLWFDLAFFGMAMVSMGVFYATSQWAAYPDWRRRALRIPAVLALGIGMSVSQSLAVFEALAGHLSPFVRTPKTGEIKKRRVLSRHLVLRPVAVAEMGFALYHAAALGWALGEGYYPSVPIQLLFAAGFATVGIRSMVRSAPDGAADAPAADVAAA